MFRKKYRIVWTYNPEFNTIHTTLVKAFSANGAWKKLAKTHAVPIHMIDIEEVKSNEVETIGLDNYWLHRKY
jgi:hypothetical protein